MTAQDFLKSNGIIDNKGTLAKFFEEYAAIKSTKSPPMSEEDDIYDAVIAKRKETAISELLSLTGCKNVGEVVEKWKGDTTYKYKCRFDAITIQELSKPIGQPQDEMTRAMFDLLDMVFKLTN